GSVSEQPLLVGRIGPGPRHHLGAVARPHLVLVGVHQRVERGPVHQAFFDQQRFERLHAQGLVGGNRLVRVIVVMVVVVAGALGEALRRRTPGGRDETASSRVHLTPPITLLYM